MYHIYRDNYALSFFSPNFTSQSSDPRPDLDSLKHSNMFFCAIDFIDLKIHVLCFDFTSFYIRPLLTMINEAKIKTW